VGTSTLSRIGPNWLRQDTVHTETLALEEPPRIETPVVHRLHDHPERAPRSTAWALLTWTLGVSFVGGITFGFAEAIRLGWPQRSIMLPRLWADALSYSALAHAVVWVAGGAAILGLLAISARFGRWVWRGSILRLLAVTFLTPVMFLVVLNRILKAGDLPAPVLIIKGLCHPWFAVMVVCLICSIVIGHVATHHPSSRLSRKVLSLRRLVLWPALAVAIACLTVQWAERPRLMEPTTNWKQAFVAPSQAPGGKPNVVVVVLDAHRVDRLGCYGYPRPTSPRLDAFAADAAVFENCISASTWTIPSHASMFTGLLPSEHGADIDHPMLDEKFTTMASFLKNDGYETIALSNNDLINPSSGLSRGFDRLLFPMSLHEIRGNDIDRFFDETLYPLGYVNTWLGALTTHDFGAKYTNQLLSNWLDRRDRRKPFFLFINYFETHSPYRPYLPHRKLFIESERLDASYRVERAWGKVFEYSLLKRDVLTPFDLQLISDLYDAEVRKLDDSVGELLEIVARRTSLDNTLVIITADHGENLGDHHQLLHTWCVYDSLAHVPLIVRYPKRLSPGRRKDLVQTIDFWPTVMDAVSGKPLPTRSPLGQSFLTSLDRTADSASVASAPATGPTTKAQFKRAAIIELSTNSTLMGLSEVKRTDPNFDASPYLGVFRAVRRGPWKYIINPDGREELYNVVDDPHETKNIVLSESEVAKKFTNVLRKQLAKTNSYERPQKPGFPTPAAEEMVQRLRSLGYVE